MNKFVSLAGYIFGFLILLFGLVVLIRAPAAGLTMLAAGVFIFPPVYKALFSKRLSLTTGHRVGLALFLLVLSFIVLGILYSPDDEDYYNLAKKDLDSTYCQKISENSLKQQCLNEVDSAFQQYQLAVTDSNLTLCELINFDSGKTKCISEVTKIIQKAAADKKLAEEQAKKAEEAAEKAVEEAERKSEEFKTLDYEGNPSGEINPRVLSYFLVVEYRIKIENDDFFDYTGVQIVAGKKFICDIDTTIIKARGKTDFPITRCKSEGYSIKAHELTSVEIKTEQGNASFSFK
jgi:hypothetical protein